VGGRLVVPCCFWWFEGGGRLMVSRFVSPDIKEKYGLELPEYEGIDQIVEVGVEGYGEEKSKV